MRHNSINMFIDKYMDFDKWMEEERKEREGRGKSDKGRNGKRQEESRRDIQGECKKWKTFTQMNLES